MCQEIKKIQGYKLVQNVIYDEQWAECGEMRRHIGGFEFVSALQHAAGGMLRWDSWIVVFCVYISDMLWQTCAGVSDLNFVLCDALVFVCWNYIMNEPRCTDLYFNCNTIQLCYYFGFILWTCCDTSMIRCWIYVVTLLRKNECKSIDLS